MSKYFNSPYSLLLRYWTCYDEGTGQYGADVIALSRTAEDFESLKKEVKIFNYREYGYIM